MEEYRRSADKLLDTVKYVEGKIINAREEIARGEGELASFDKLEKDLKSTRREIKKLDISIKKLKADGSVKRKIVEELEKIKEKVALLKSALVKLESDKSRHEVILLQREKEKSQAKTAAIKIKDLEDDYQAHLKALGMIKELERERIEREKLSIEMTKVEAAIIKVKAEQTTTNDEKKKIREAYREIKELTPGIRKQEKLEKQRESLRNLISDAKSAESHINTLETRIEKLREQYRENQRQKKEAEERSTEAKRLNEWQKCDDDLRKTLANLKAQLERDQKFQNEIHDGLCPILSAKCLNLNEDQTLDIFFTNKLLDLTLQIGKIEKQQVEAANSLRISRDADKFVSKLDSLIQREKEIFDDGLILNKEKESLEKNISDLEKLQKELSEVEDKLEFLDNPKARIMLLEKETAHEISLREKTTNIESNLERLESDRRFKVEQLEAYKHLDSSWKKFLAIREKTSDAHREYVANESDAKSLPEKEKELERSQRENCDLEKNLAETRIEFEKENEGFSSETYSAEKHLLVNIENELIEARLNNEHLKTREAELEGEIKRLKKIRVLVKKEFKEKERLEKVSDAVAFIRATLKEAAPRVARNYVCHVSIEANQMFRAITGNAERTLRWADDYGILLEEDGYERPFQNFSGGEQMAAALSVRLAILKQLSDLRIAFFDEPTMNMDFERREGLAEQISQITENQTFDQLFVISHDETFEGYVDNVIKVPARCEST